MRTSLIGKNCRGMGSAYMQYMKKIHMTCILGLCLVCFKGFSGENGTDPPEAQIQIMVEQGLAEKISSLERQLVGAKNIIQESSGTREKGYFEELQRKALAYEAASSAIDQRERTIEKLKKELCALESLKTSLEQQVLELSASTNELTEKVAKLQKENEPIREALDLIRKGKFEYYQVREGDTCESIAAQPGIYNDSAKSILIRQANRGGGSDLDNLAPGEVLVIPRFTLGESFEF